MATNTLLVGGQIHGGGTGAVTTYLVPPKNASRTIKYISG